MARHRGFGCVIGKGQRPEASLLNGSWPTQWFCFIVLGFVSAGQGLVGRRHRLIGAVSFKDLALAFLLETLSNWYCPQRTWRSGAGEKQAHLHRSAKHHLMLTLLLCLGNAWPSVVSENASLRSRNAALRYVRFGRPGIAPALSNAPSSETKNRTPCREPEH